MSAAGVKLEDFSAAFGSGNAPGLGAGFQASEVPGAVAGEDHQQAYERGYAAGWDDAMRAADEEQARITTDFAHNLQDLSFTFHEARSHVIAAMVPLLDALVRKVLPELAYRHIGQQLLEELKPLVEQAADEPIRIMVSPACRPALEKLLQTGFAHPFELLEEPSLAAGQVHLRSGSLERRFDAGAALSNIADSLAALEAANKEAFSDE